MPNDTAPAWPDPARPGVPLNPERGGWHWVVAADPAVSTQSAPWWWVATRQHWLPPCDVNSASPLIPARARWRYLGPCLTPSEVAAHTAATWLAAREACAKREDAYANALYHQDPGIYGDNGGIRELIDAAESRAAAIRALSPPADAMAALEEMLEQARREGFMLAHDVAISALLPSDGAMYSADFKAQLSAHHALEKAKAAMEEAADAYGIRAGETKA